MFFVVVVVVVVVAFGWSQTNGEQVQKRGRPNFGSVLFLKYPLFLRGVGPKKSGVGPKERGIPRITLKNSHVSSDE